jgi:hypothetical protein
MPLPIQHSSSIEEAVHSVLEKAGVLVPKEKFSQALESNGITIDQLAAQLSTLIYTAREGTRLKALEIALAAHGIELRESKITPEAPTIIFNISTGDVQSTNMMFAPVREIKSLDEMRLLNAPTI